ncbi:MAG: hypothetical protein QM811_23965 [Pirellulales bacterium]
MLADDSPLPRELTTPPVTKMCFVMSRKEMRGPENASLPDRRPAKVTLNMRKNKSCCSTLPLKPDLLAWRMMYEQSPKSKQVRKLIHRNEPGIA